MGVVRFQTGNVATTESLLDTGLGFLPTLRQVSLTSYGMSSHTLLPILSHGNPSQSHYIQMKSTWYW